MTYFNTHAKLHRHFERFHDESRQVDRGFKRGGLKDSDEDFRKRNKVMGNDVEMYGEGHNIMRNIADNMMKVTLKVG